MKCILLFIFLTFTYLLKAQPTRPYPQHVRYTLGTIKPSHVSQIILDSEVTTFYREWKKKYIKEGCEKDQFYIWAQGIKKIECVSEGQGYGMVIIALMAGIDGDEQKIYDGMFRYFKHHPSRRSPSLMAWQQLSGCGDAEKSSATDGDIDICYSLILADAQWGSKGIINYRLEALTMIDAIMKQEINPKTWSVILSNDVEEDSHDYFDMRTSDFIPTAFKLFGILSKDANWNKVVDHNYTLFHSLQTRFSPDAGLVPDFVIHTNSNAVPPRGKYLESKYDGSYNYNACRVPWRIGLDYLLTGDKKSKAFIDKINLWIRKTTSNTPDNISAGYTLGGDDLPRRYFEALSFISPFAVAAMTDAKNQEWLNRLWDYLTGFKMSEFDYYDNTIRLIGSIILSGNYWQPDVGK